MAGALVYGEQYPLYGESPVSWQTWSDGAGGTPTIEGDPDWGRLVLEYSGADARSEVIDHGSLAYRTYVITENRYGGGYPGATIQIRYSDTAFLQDDALPAWNDYSGPVTYNCQYVQIRTATYTGTVYYVDATSGNDGNDGLSPSTAWKTITKVNTVSFSPGDAILFKTGETFTGPLIPEDSGDSSSYITYSSYGGDAKPIITGAATGALWITNSYTYMRFIGIDFSGSTGTTPVVRANSNHLQFKNCIFRDSAGYIGYTTYSSIGGSDIHDILVQDCVAYNNYKSGFFCSSNDGSLGPYNVTFDRCTAYDNGTDIWADHGFYVGFGCTVSNCLSYDNMSAGIKVNQNLHPGSSFAPIVYNCISRTNKVGLYVGHERALFYNNLVYDNTSVNIDFDSEGDDCEFYFNTFANSRHASWYSIDIDPSNSTGNIFKNNIFVQDLALGVNGIIYVTTTIDDLSTLCTFDYNTYYYNGSVSGNIIYQTGGGGASIDWNEWRASAGSPEAHGTLLTSLPDFVTRYTDFHPINSGNLEGIGLYMAAYPYDMEGTPRQNPPTPGCYEVSGT